MNPSSPKYRARWPRQPIEDPEFGLMEMLGLVVVLAGIGLAVAELFA